MAARGEWLAHRTALPRAKFSISSRKCLHNASVAFLEFPLLPRVWFLQPRRRLLGTGVFSSPQRDSLQSCRCQGSPVADKEAARVRFPCNHVDVRAASLHRLVVKCGVSDYNFDDYSSVDLKYCGGAASWGGGGGGNKYIPPTAHPKMYPPSYGRTRARVREPEAHFSFDLECSVRCACFRDGGGSASCPFIGAFPTRGCISLLWRAWRHEGGMQRILSLTMERLVGASNML